MSVLIGLLVFLAFWVASVLLLAFAIFIIRHVYVSRGLRSFFIPFELLSAVLVNLIVIVATRSIFALVFAIPVGFILFAVGLLGLSYNSWIAGGMVAMAKRHGGDDLFPGLLPDDEPPEPRDYAKHHRYIAALLRFSDWFEPKTPKDPGSDERVLDLV